MVNVIENRALVSGRPTGPATEASADRWVTARLTIVESEDVEGYPNLLTTDLPREVTVLVPTELYRSSLAGAETWRVVAELVGPNRIRVLDTDLAASPVLPTERGGTDDGSDEGQAGRGRPRGPRPGDD